MMKELYDNYDEARQVFACADDVLGKSISKLCFEGAQDELDLTCNTQCCMLAADLAAAYTLEACGIKPDVIAGFSLGEYAALVCSGVISIEYAFRVVQLKADAIIRIADEKGIKTVRLPVSVPSHCKLMEPVAEAASRAFSTVVFSEPQIPIFSDVTGNLMKDPEEIRGLLVKQITDLVRWIDILRNMDQMGINIFVECGTGRTLSGLVRKALKGKIICRVEDIKTLEDTKIKIGGNHDDR